MKIIEGFRISNYRSFGVTAQLVGPLKKVNLIVGQNNSGKSNVLRFLKNHYVGMFNNIGNETQYPYDGYDVHRGEDPRLRQFIIGIPFDSNRITEKTKSSPSVAKNVKKVLEWFKVENHGDAGWIPFLSENGSPFRVEEALVNRFDAGIPISAGDWIEIWRHFTNQHHANSSSNVAISETLTQSRPTKSGNRKLRLFLP